MEVNVTAFRALKNRTFSFQSGLNLIRGKNGSGKTTVFSAIEWCLYNRGDALPWDERKAAVTLKIPSRQFQAERRKGPQVFKVQYEDKEYIDKEGDEIVLCLFGSYDVWKASCYIPQESRTRLLSGTKESQMHTLNTLIFSDTDPSLVQKKIEVHRKEVLEQEGKLRAKVEGLQAGIGEVKDINSSSTEIQQMIQMLEGTLREVEASEYKRLQEEERRKEAQQQLQKLESKSSEGMEAPIDYTKDEALVASMRSSLELEEKYIQAQKKVEEIRKQLEHLPEPSRMTYTVQAYASIEQQERTYSNQQKILSALRLTADEVPEKIQKLERVLSKEEVLRAIQGLSFSPEEESEEVLIREIQEKEQLLYEAKQYKNILECPSCSKTLQMKQGVLVEVTHKPDIKSEEAYRLDLEKGKIRLENRRKTLQYNSLKTLLEDVPENTDIQTIRQIHFALKQLGPIVKKPESAELYQREMQSAELKKEEKVWSASLPSHTISSSSSSSLREEIKAVQERIQKAKKAEETRRFVEMQIKTVQERLLTYVVIEDQTMKLQMTRTVIENLRTKIVEVQVQEAKKEKIAILEKVSEEASSLSSDVVYIQRVKDILRSVQSERIDQALEGINQTVNRILPMMFEEDIEIHLRTLKETRNGKVKNELNMVIRKKGNNLKSIQDLSVGQASRVSMALNVALTMLTPCPFLLLDETFAPVDMNMHDASLSAIRESIPAGRIIICASHVESGMYDSVCDL